jgi:hypothetical protein
MTLAEIATCAYDQIDQARAELNGVSYQTTYERLRTPSRNNPRIPQMPTSLVPYGLAIIPAIPTLAG